MSPCLISKETFFKIFLFPNVLHKFSHFNMVSIYLSFLPLKILTCLLFWILTYIYWFPIDFFLIFYEVFFVFLNFFLLTKHLFFYIFLCNVVFWDIGKIIFPISQKKLLSFFLTTSIFFAWLYFFIYYFFYIFFIFIYVFSNFCSTNRIFFSKSIYLYLFYM